MEASKINAAAYVRASTELQKYSTVNQVYTLGEFGAAHGFEIVEVYEDNGRSGLDLKGRPALRRLLQDALREPRPFEAILVYDVSRWGRFQDVDESAFYEHLCKRAGVQLIYAQEPFENDNSPIANIMKAIKRAMAAEFSRELSRKVQIAQIKMAERGYWQGGEPGYGLRRALVDEEGVRRRALPNGERKNILNGRVILERGARSEGAIVRRIFRMFVADGLTMGEIARRLNREGVPAPRAEYWNRSFISRILRHERYIGTLVFNRTTVRLRQPRRYNAELLWVRRPDTFEGTVPRILFDQAQAKLTYVHRPPKSDEEMIADLRSLLAQEGRLSHRLIKATSGVAHPATYLRRFGSLANAYALAGFERTPTENSIAASKRRAYTGEYMLAKLKALYEREGVITGAIISADPDMPSKTTYQLKFGSLRAAYRLIGLEPLKPGQGPKALLGQPRSNPMCRTRSPLQIE